MSWFESSNDIRIWTNQWAGFGLIWIWTNQRREGAQEHRSKEGKMLLEAHCRRALWFILTVLIHGRLCQNTFTATVHSTWEMKCSGPSCNVYYPGFKRNFWLEFSSPSPSSPAPPPPTHPPPPRPLFLSPGSFHHKSFQSQNLSPPRQPSNSTKSIPHKLHYHHSHHQPEQAFAKV